MDRTSQPCSSGTPAATRRAVNAAPFASSAGLAVIPGTAAAMDDQAFGSTAATTVPPAAVINVATSGASGPAPATSTRLPGRTPYAFNITVAAPRPITPGSVQPGRG